MNDWYNDPPESPEPPECCGDFMDTNEDGSCTCPKCGKRIEPQPDPYKDYEPETEPTEPFPHEDALPEERLCPHGHEASECNACMIASDFAYDANRERSWR